MFDRLAELFHLRRKKKCPGDDPNKSPDWSPGQLCRRFSLADVKLITNHFNESYIIGRGGFGTVFKGRLANGAPVAVKRWLSTSRQGVAEFWNEIEMLSQLRHRHIVNLIGYCDEKGEMILVYDYAPRGSLADYLHLKTSTTDGVLPTPLTWLERLQICIGAAHGLNYLHSGTSLQCNVIHRDLKSSNILLDDNLTAKISDFGLAKLGPGSEYRSYSMVPVDRSSDVTMTTIAGTVGYIDPAYYRTNRVSFKSDVYAFGVVLFEVLCGRPALLNSSFDQERQNLARWAVSCMKEGRLDWIVDPNLDGQILPECLRVFAQIARQCVHARPEKRPTMAEVLVRLKFAFALQQMGYTSLGEGALIFTSGAHEEQEDSDSEENGDTFGDINSRENADSLMENEVISAGNSMDHHELINWISNTGGTHNKQDDAASSMEQEVIDAGNVGHVSEQINGSIITGGAGDVGHHSAQMAETSDSGRASDKQQNASSSTGKEVVNAVDGGHHDDQIGDISITGGAYDKKEEMTLIPDQVVINAGNGGEPAEQVDGNTQLVGPSSGGTEPESMKLMKKLQLLFGDLTRVISAQTLHLFLLYTSIKQDNGYERMYGIDVLLYWQSQVMLFNAVNEHVSGGGLKSSRNNKSKSELLSGQIVTLNPKMFTFSDLRRATNNFRPDVVLGKGGSGIVFKGWIDERTYTPSKVGVGMAIAVKKLDINGSLRPKEAQLKVKFLGKLSHPNLVKILGYCLEDDDFLLVYEHVQKRSLECHLFEKDAESIPWVKRMKIAIGAARGLNYLHKTKEQATYRSFKASDILLDGDFNAKLSDYGLTKLGQMNEESIISTLMPGDSAYIDFPQKDVGYIDPEYMTTGNLTVKSDVYGFGAVLLEILTGQRVLDMNWPDGNHDLVRYARPFLTGKKKLRSILDRRLEDNNPLKDETLSAIGALAINCLEDYPKNRPAMKEVLETLERINAIQMEPKETSSATEGHRTVHTEE
ncbi:hypothetical protein RJ640_003068 [Escallonia rubra]|uniref:Protein kinase domain-containing protein n=1 Tax=Escallonia rubra TaxID=112253 RepID=A0AA88QPR2_9ASTE|nr:hypothetical protein RJ640_003068 [Escallonia rubra]